MMMQTQSPGEVVLEELGMTCVASRLGVHPTTVWRWSQPAPTGSDGNIPSKYHRALLELAENLGRRLTTDDLVLGRRPEHGNGARAQT